MPVLSQSKDVRPPSVPAYGGMTEQCICEQSLKNMREFPVPEAVGIQNMLDSLTHPNARTAKPAIIMDTSLMEEITKSGFIDKLYGRAPKNER